MVVSHYEVDGEFLDIGTPTGFCSNTVTRFPHKESWGAGGIGQAGERGNFFPITPAF